MCVKYLASFKQPDGGHPVAQISAILEKCASGDPPSVVADIAYDFSIQTSFIEVFVSTLRALAYSAFLEHFENLNLAGSFIWIETFELFEQLR